MRNDVLRGVAVPRSCLRRNDAHGVCENFMFFFSFIFRMERGERGHFYGGSTFKSSGVSEFSATKADVGFVFQLDLRVIEMLGIVARVRAFTCRLGTFFFYFLNI